MRRCVNTILLLVGFVVLPNRVGGAARGSCCLRDRRRDHGRGRGQRRAGAHVRPWARRLLPALPGSQCRPGAVCGPPGTRFRTRRAGSHRGRCRRFRPVRPPSRPVRRSRVPEARGRGLLRATSHRPRHPTRQDRVSRDRYRPSGARSAGPSGTYPDAVHLGELHQRRARAAGSRIESTLDTGRSFRISVSAELASRWTVQEEYADARFDFESVSPTLGLFDHRQRAAIPTRTRTGTGSSAAGHAP